MKKWLTVFLLGILLCSNARALTFDELRAQTPQTLTLQIDGIKLSIPVKWPDADEAPVMYIQTMPVDVERLTSIFGSAVQRDTGKGRIHLILPGEGIPKEIGEAFEHTLRQSEVPWKFGVHKTINSQNWPRLYGVVLAGGIPMCDGAGIGNYMWFSSHEDGGWELSMSYMDVPTEKAWDVDFVPFETIAGQVQRRIDAGTLKAVDGIELWYGKQKKNGATVITPIWRVFGYDTQYHKWHKGGMPDADLRYRRCPPRDFSIPLDASTGEVLVNQK